MLQNSDRIIIIEKEVFQPKTEVLKFRPGAHQAGEGSRNRATSAPGASSRVGATKEAIGI